MPSSPGPLPAAGPLAGLALARLTLSIFSSFAGLFSFTLLPLPGLFAFPCLLGRILTRLTISILPLSAGSLAARLAGTSLASRGIPAPLRWLAAFRCVGQCELRRLLFRTLLFPRAFLLPLLGTCRALTRLPLTTG